MADVTKTIEINIEESEETRRALREINKQWDEFNRKSKEAEDQNKETGESFLQATDQVKVFGTSVGSLRKAFLAGVTGLKTFVGGLKTLRGAIIATGIGAILIALTSLSALFTRNQKAVDALSKKFKQFGAVVDVILDRLVIFGQGVIEIFSSLEAVVVGFFTRNKTVFDIGVNRFKEGLLTIKSSAEGITEEIVNEYEAVGILEERFQSLEKAKIANIVTDAKLRAELKRYNKDAEDTSLAIEKRLDSANKAIQVEETRSRNSIALIEEEIAILEERQSLSDNLNADTEELNNLIAERYRIQEESLERLTTAQNKFNILRQQNDKDFLEGQELITKAYEDNEKRKADAVAITIDTTKKYQSQADKETKARLLNEIKLEEEKTKTILQLNANLFGALAGLAGQDSAFGKALAIGQATINTYLGVSRALADYRFPASLIVGATVLAQGLKTVKDIVGVPIPKVQTVETSFGDGGLVNGASHGNGGVKFMSPSGMVELEGGEAIINRRATSIFKPLLSSINASTGGNKFAQGGMIPSLNMLRDSNTFQIDQFAQALNSVQTVLVVEDVTTKQSQIQVREDRANLG